jgi:hypothetical protein
MKLVDLLLREQEYGCEQWIYSIEEVCHSEGYSCEICQLRFQAAAFIEDLVSAAEDAISQLRWADGELGQGQSCGAIAEQLQDVIKYERL